MWLAKRRRGRRGRWDLVLLRPKRDERPTGVISNNATAESRGTGNIPPYDVVG
jgi:hypothetical protein